MKIHNIVHYVTRKYMRLNKKRTLVTYIGITLMVVLMTCVFAGKDTAMNYMREAASMVRGKWDVCADNVNEEKISRIKEIPYITDTAWAYSNGMTEFSQSGNPDVHPYLDVRSYSSNCFSWMNINVSSGRLPENSHELIVSKTAADEGAKLKIGDSISADFFDRSLTGTQKEASSTVFPLYNIELKRGETLVVPWNFPYFPPNEDFVENHVMTGEKADYTVVGFMDAPSYEQEGAAGYIALTMADSSKAGKERVQLLAQFDLKNLPQDYYDLMEIAGTENVSINSYRMIFSGDSGDSTFNLLITGMTIFFVVLIMCASIILIYNVFGLSFRERSKYLGMLSSVGATARQRRSSIYYEAFLLLAGALPVGLLLGMGVVKLGMYVLRPYIRQFLLNMTEDIPVRLYVPAAALAVIVLLSILTVLLSAFFPARRISKSGAVESIRGNGAGRKKGYCMNVKRIKWFGAEGLLADCFIRRQRKKSGSIRMAGIIFMIILFMTAFGAQAVHTIAAEKTDETGSIENELADNQCELTLYNDSEEDKEWKKSAAKMDAVEKELAANANISHIETWYTGMFAGEVESGVLSNEYWEAFADIAGQYGEEPEKYKNSGRTAISIKVLDDESLKTVADRIGASDGVIFVNSVTLSTDVLILNDSSPKRYRSFQLKNITDMKPGDTFDFLMNTRETGERVRIPMSVAGSATNEDLRGYFKTGGEHPWILISEKTAGMLAEKAGYSSISSMLSRELRFQMKKPDNQLIQQLTQLIADDWRMHLQTVSASRINKNMTDSLVKIADILLISFVILTSLICLINLVSSVSGQMAERRKEFAIMESIGMTRKQMKKMLLLENIRILLQGMVVSVIVAGILTTGIYRVLSGWFGRITFPVPYALGVLAVAITGAAMTGLGLYYFKRESGQNLIENIQKEIV